MSNINIVHFHKRALRKYVIYCLRNLNIRTHLQAHHFDLVIHLTDIYLLAHYPT